MSGEAGASRLLPGSAGTGVVLQDLPQFSFVTRFAKDLDSEDIKQWNFMYSLVWYRSTQDVLF